MTWPSYEEWNTNTAFVQISFNAFERTTAVEEFFSIRDASSAFHVCSVVAGKYHNGILIQSYFLELLQNAADIIIHTCDHGRICCFGLWLLAIMLSLRVCFFRGENAVPILILVLLQVFFRHYQLCMGKRVRNV